MPTNHYMRRNKQMIAQHPMMPYMIATPQHNIRTHLYKRLNRIIFKNKHIIAHRYIPLYKTLTANIIG